MVLTDTEGGCNAKIGQLCLGDLLDQFLACGGIDGFGQERVKNSPSCVHRLEVLLVIDRLENIPGRIHIQLRGVSEERILVRA